MKERNQRKYHEWRIIKEKKCLDLPNKKKLTLIDI